MSILRVIADETPAPRPAPKTTPGPVRRSWLWLPAICAVLATVALTVWWVCNDTTREIQAMPREQRIALYHSTLANLANVCDPAAPRSLREFCHREAELVLRFQECDGDPRCQELARRHLPRPYR